MTFMSIRANKVFYLLPIAALYGLCLLPNLNQLVFPGYNFYDIKRILVLAILAYMGLQIIISRSIRQDILSAIKLLSSWQQLALVLILILGLCSSATAAEPKWALIEIANYALLIIFAFYIASYLIQSQALVWPSLLIFLLLSALIYSAIFFGVYIQGLHDPAMAVNLAKGMFPGFVNLRFFAQFQIFTLPLLLLLYFKTQDKNYRAIIFFVSTIWWLIAWVNAAKGLALGLVISLLLLLVCGAIKTMRRYLVLQMLSLGIAFLLYLLLYKSGFIVSSLNQGVTGLDGSSNARLQLWQYCLSLISKYPALGVGPMHFAYYVPLNLQAAHPHNSFLQIAAEWGSIAALLLLVLIISGVISAIKKAKTANDLDLWVLIWALLAGLFYSLVSGVIVTPLTQLTLALIAGCLIGYQYVHSNDKYNSLSVDNFRIKVTQIILLLAIFISVAFLAYAILPTIKNLPQQDWTWFHIGGGREWGFSPRFWLQGLLRHG